MEFAQALLNWYDREKRAFAWRGATDPYRIWVSEIMLQQTRTEVVSLRYDAFMREFPDVFALGAADAARVLKAWEGMGYYSRARNMHRAAKIIAQSGGAFPRTMKALKKLPGIGDYTAGAIASIAFNEAVPALDGNQVRVLSRVLAYEKPIAVPAQLYDEALARVPKDRPGDYNQALMDLSARICKPTRPQCENCPIAQFCIAGKEGIAEEYPKKPAPIARREIILTVYIIMTPKGVLIKKRPAKGLLAGLWEFPNTEGESAALPAGCELLQKLPTAKHVFTHLVWKMQGVLLRAEGALDDTVPVNAAGLRDAAMPSAFRKYREIALEIMKQ